MKILNVNNSLDPIAGGGTGERTFQMCCSLVKNGHKCTLLTLDLGLDVSRLKALAGVEVVALPALLRRYFIPIFSLSRLFKIVRDNEIIHLMGHWSILNALVYFIARKLKRPYVVCPAGALIVFGRSRLLKRVYNFIIGNRIIKNAAGHIAVTSQEAEQFYAYGIKKEQITFIPNAINEGDYRMGPDGEPAFREKYGLGRNPYILFVGRLNPIKGPDLLVKSFVAAQDCLAGHHLVLAGSDEGMLPELKRIVKQNKLDEQVHFIGYLSGADKAQAYKSAELLVIPSRHEAMSIVVLEAGIVGTPTLITDQCGFNIVAEIGGGWVVQPTIEGLTNGLRQVITNRSRLPSMGDILQTFVRQNFSWDGIVFSYLNLYQKIIERAKQSKIFPIRVVRNMRPLYFHGQNLYCSQYNKIFMTNDFGGSFNYIGCINYSSRYGKLFSVSPFLQRLFRAQVYRMRILENGNKVFIFKGGIYTLNKGELQAELTCAIEKGSRPVSLAVTLNGLVVFGQYWSNQAREAVSIYASQDQGRSWRPIYTFPAKTICHIHGISFDEWENCFWICTGDQSKETCLIKASIDFKKVEVILQGEQKYRFYSILVFREKLILANDSPGQQNHIYSFNKISQQLIREGQIENTSFYSCLVSNRIFISTTAEPNQNNDSRHSYVWSRLFQEGEWKRILSFDTDFLHNTSLLLNLPKGLFQFPRVFFPEGENASKVLVCHLIGLKKYDNAMLCFDASVWDS